GEGLHVSPYPFNVLYLKCINLSVDARKGDDCVLIAMFGAVELGVIYAIMAVGVSLIFHVLHFPDLTVHHSFVPAAVVAAILIMNGVSPLLATVLATLAGFLAGCMTGVLHTKGKINPLLSGILMMIALYSINLRIMGQPTLSLLNESTVFTQLRSFWDRTGIDSFLNGMW